MKTRLTGGQTTAVQPLWEADKVLACHPAQRPTLPLAHSYLVNDAIPTSCLRNLAARLGTTSRSGLTGRRLNQ